ncbi:hypothetical protein BS50DRAFT_490758 [Corynespora cassiicola Philippines]|uniref:C2H2-type domain-containing protein n=1 Tax=Corynespora cassiicola Philippines TaxID=1448308 RepID=A0A2T2NUP6_CORCC|nr:hypothetical protein BS50DRAFT_490758 [Corynespora cassiicola Philippines]
MHPGSDPMGAPPSFATRRPHAAQLGNFELPPPPMHKYSSFNTVNASQSSQAPTTIASVGNLLTPPNNIPGDVISPSSGVSTSSAHSTTMPYANGNYIYSPPAQGQHHYGYPTAQQQQQHQHQNQYNQGRGGTYSSLQNPRQLGNQSSLTPPKALNPPPYEMNQQLPPFPPSSASSNMPTMSAQQQQPHHMMSTQAPASSSAPQQSPAHAQEPFRPPPTPTYNSYQPSTTPQQSSFPYSTGPSPTQQSPISAGGSMPRMSPAVSQGSIPSIPSNQAQSPHPYQRPYAGYLPGPAPVFSNVNNPSGQLALVGHPGMMQGFNSGHAAAIPHFLGQHAHQQPAANDRPFKCDQCPQSFNRNHDLKRHKRIHLAVKPFPCTHCDKSFSRKDALKRHILVKGCGKVSNSGEDVKRESHSPDHKTDSIDTKAVIASHA